MTDRVTPESWYRVRRVGDDVTWIDEPFVKAFYRCNIWHVRGRDRDLLVDSGMGVVSLRRHVPLVTERPLVAVASHTHFDHVGGHHELAERWVHGAEAAVLAAPDRDNTLIDPWVTDDIFDRPPPEPFTAATYAGAGGAGDARPGRGRRGRPRRPGVRGAAHARPLARRHRPVRARHRAPVLG